MQNASIKVFPSKLDAETFEQCWAEPGITFGQWLTDNVPAYRELEQPLFSAAVNGMHLATLGWDAYVIQPGDEFELVVEAKAEAVIAWAIVAVAAAAYAVYQVNQIPDNYNTTTPDGSSIYEANAQGNRPRLMGVVPEIAGRHKVFPDLLNPPRREYIANEQWLYLMMAIGVGEYEINADEIYIGNTPVSRYAGDIDYEIFGPGEFVTSHEAMRHVYTSTEVGASAGQSGFELEGLVVSAGGSEDDYNRWTFAGTGLTAYVFDLENKYGPGGASYAVPFPFAVGDILTITGSTGNEGDFRVVSVSGYTATMQKVDSNGDDVAGWTGFTSHNLSFATVETNSVTSGNYAGPFFACPENETTFTLWLDFLLQEGLYKLEDNGSFSSRTVTLEIQYRDEGDVSWTTVTHTFTAATNDQIGQTVAINLGTAQRPEVRVRRATAASNNVKIKDTVQWTALKAELAGATSYADTTTIAIKIRGTNALAGSAENKFNMIVTRKLPVWDGSSWSLPAATDDIAPFFSYIIKDCGHSDAQIGLDALGELHPLWNARGDTFCAVFDNKSTLFEALKRTLAPGYAEPTLDYGQIVPVRDGLRSSWEQQYQPDNMVGELTQAIKLIEPDEPDGVEVEYTDPDTWKPATILCQLPGDVGLNPKKVRAYGITDRTRAWRYGMRQRRAQRYRRTSYSFKTEMDGLNSAYLSYVALADDIPGYAQTGRVEAVSGRDITLDAAVEWGSGTHHLALRKPDGTLSGPYVATATSDPYTVTLDADLDFTPVVDGSMEPPLWMFGEAERWCYPALVTEIKPSGTDNVSLTAVNYDARVYADDDNAPS